jgi:predicted acyltransferase
MPAAAAAEALKPRRLLSVDLLRGLTIFFMILVNDPGSEEAYAPLKHAYWNGFTPTDLVFPTFLFLVGITTAFSVGSRLHRGDRRSAIFVSILRRSVLLYLLGMLVNTFPFTDLTHIRYLGVLHRIAVCYFVVGSLLLISRGWKDKAVLLAVCLVGYWALLRFVPVPGYGIPIHDVPLLNRDGNLAAWVDRWMFAPQHLYERTRDPEGLLSDIPAIGTALMGLLTGMGLRTKHTLKQKIFAIAAAGAVSVALGLLWNITLPINKKMWTSSYVLFAGGLSLLLLAACMALVEVPAAAESNHQRSQRSAWFMPLLVFGMNAIAAYVISECLAAATYTIKTSSHLTLHRVSWNAIHSVIPDKPFASLVFSLLYVFVCWIPVYLLYRRKIFLKV